MTDRNFRDLQHTMALPYVDAFVREDNSLVAIIRRLSSHFPFRVGEIVSRAEVDSRFLS
jgi:hypothetical protein